MKNAKCKMKNSKLNIGSEGLYARINMNLK